MGTHWGGDSESSCAEGPSWHRAVPLCSALWALLGWMSGCSWQHRREHRPSFQGQNSQAGFWHGLLCRKLCLVQPCSGSASLCHRTQSSPARFCGQYLQRKLKIVQTQSRVCLQHHLCVLCSIRPCKPGGKGVGVDLFSAEGQDGQQEEFLHRRGF